MKMCRDFDIEAGWSNCEYDHLEIRDGDSRNSSVVGRYCGDSSMTPGPITSSYNHLYITFVTDGSVQNRGFVLNYTTIEVSGLFCCNDKMDYLYLYRLAEARVEF